MKAAEIAEALKHDAANVARELFPNGTLQGREWCIGSIAGEEGQSLKICISGAKVGIWMDFASENQKGDLLDLWMAVKGCDLPEAMRQACSFLGIDQPKPYRQKEIQYKKPFKPKSMVRIKNAPAAHKYMTEARGINQATLDAFQLCGDDAIIYFPFIREGQADMVKQLKIKRLNGKKDIRPTSKDQMKCLFGWQAVSPDSRVVIICEGEINAMSIWQMGFAYGVDVLSVPFGGGAGKKQDWIENEFDDLERYDLIYLWFDNDEAGQAAIPEIVGRLGCERCRVIESSCDANDQLLKQMDWPGLKTLLDNSIEQTPSSLCRLKEYKEEIWADINDPYAFERGYRLLYPSMGTTFVFRPGETTVLTGVNSHGKSVGAGQMVVSILSQSGIVCVASLESKPHKWMAKILKQYHALNLTNFGDMLTNRSVFDSVFKWFNEGVLAYGSPGQGVCADILEVFRYSRRRYGATFFLIDNLSALDVPLDDYEGQRRFIQRLVDFAKTENVHVLLVAHQRKGDGDGDYKAGNRFKIKGSGALSDLADNVLIWWRNKSKEDKIRQGAFVEAGSPDAMLICDKQRETGVEPVFKLWFEPKGAIFLTEPPCPQLTDTDPGDWARFDRD